MPFSLPGAQQTHQQWYKHACGCGYLGSKQRDLEIPHLIASETAQLQQFPLNLQQLQQLLARGQRCEDKSRGKEERETLTPMAGEAGPVPYTSPSPPGKGTAWTHRAPGQPHSAGAPPAWARPYLRPCWPHGDANFTLALTLKCTTSDQT